MSAWLVYLWTRLDDINFLFFMFSIILSFCVGITGLVGYTDENEECKKSFKKLFFPTILIVLLAVMIPTKKDVTIIYVAPKLMNSKIITEDCPELAKLGIEALKQQLIKFTITENKK